MTLVLHKGTKVLREDIYYMPTYLIDDKGLKPTGECSLFVRRYRLIETRAGRRRIGLMLDVWTFDDTDEMVTAIEEHGLKELPAEADTDHDYLPAEFRRFKRARIEREFGRIPMSDEEAA